jgi:23S rRNA (guanosine2251-2'-O)-methyltransferase
VRGSAEVRRELGGDQVEGRQAVRELLGAHRRAVHEVWMMEGTDPAAILREIQSLARAGHVPVRLVTQRQIQQAQGSEAPQGVIAFAEPLTEADLSELVGLTRKYGSAAHPVAPEENLALPGEEASDAAGLQEELGEAISAGHELGDARSPKAANAAFLVVVDGVTDPQNLGALLRSAECAGVSGIVLPRHRSAHVTPTVTKVAAGAVEHVPIAVVPGVPGALQELERLGVWTVGLDERGPEPLFGLSLGDRPIALVIGAEGRGLAPLARQRCDVLARIPLHGSIDSLNVAAAGAVAMFEVVRQRSTQPR